MSDSPAGPDPRLRALQARIDAALREPPDTQAAAGFSPYALYPGPDPADALMAAAALGGLAGLAAALDTYDRLAATENPGRLRQALRVFLAHSPDVAQLGLRIPSLAERSPWKLGPSGGG